MIYAVKTILNGEPLYLLHGSIEESHVSEKAEVLSVHRRITYTLDDLAIEGFTPVSENLFYKEK